MTALSTTLRLTVEITGYLSGLTALIANTRRAIKRVKMGHELFKLTDRHLADLGIERKEIPFLADQAALNAVPRAKSLLGQLVAWNNARERRVATHRQLNALDERMLADIGIDPGQLRAISGTMVSTVTKIKEAARFVAQPVSEFTTAAKLAELDFQVAPAANQDPANQVGQVRKAA